MFFFSSGDRWQGSVELCLTARRSVEDDSTSTTMTTTHNLDIYRFLSRAHMYGIAVELWRVYFCPRSCPALVKPSFGHGIRLKFRSDFRVPITSLGVSGDLP